MKRIAVVEDEVYMREELCSMLKKAGYSVLEITAFEDAGEQLTAINPDLVILDLNLPEISGFQSSGRARVPTGPGDVYFVYKQHFRGASKKSGKASGSITVRGRGIGNF